MSSCDRCGKQDGTLAPEEELLGKLICSGCWKRWEGLKAETAKDFVNELVEEAEHLKATIGKR